MTWRAKQGPATFRGVPFFVEVGEQGGGRQTATHVFPFSELPPYTEDMGRRPREFTVDAYVIGDDYEASRDALISALEKPGPGELVHPYFGTRQVALSGDFRVRQSRTEGGMASFTIPFVETSAKPVAPSSTMDAGSVLGSKVGAAKLATRSQLLASREVQAYPLAVDLAASEFGVLTGALSRMSEVLRSLPISSTLRAQFERAIESDPKGEFETQSEYLFALFDGVFGVVADALETITTPVNKVAAFLRLASFDPGPRPARAAEQPNYDATSQMIRRLAVIYAAEAAGAQVFVSYDDAVAARETVTDAIDELAEAVADDSFPAIQDMRSALVEAVPGPDSDLPRLQAYTPRGTVPSLVLAHRLYGNLDREQDLIDRNRIRNPAFIAGGQELEILSDGE